MVVLTQMLEAPVIAQDKVASKEHGEAADPALLYGGVAPHPACPERQITWLVARSVPICTHHSTALLAWATDSNHRTYMPT